MTVNNTQVRYVENPRDYFFSFGSVKSLNVTLPLVCNSGFLLVDSGEVDPSFIYRCQDRYFVYTSMIGFRSLFFVSDNQHFEIYTHLIDKLRQRFVTNHLWNDIWVNLVLPDPCFIPCDPLCSEVFFTPLLAKQMQRPEIRDSFLATGLFCNQVSPTLTHLLGQWLQYFQDDGFYSIDLKQCDIAGQLAIRFHDKSSYVRLVETISSDELPLHTPTIALTCDELLEMSTWDKLHQRFVATTKDTISFTTFYVKSSFDSGGNAAAILTEKGYVQQHSAFFQKLLGTTSLMDTNYCLTELCAAVEAQPSLAAMGWSQDTLTAYATAWANKRRQYPLAVLVQRQICPVTNCQGLPHGIGYSLLLTPNGTCQILAIAAQVYSDPAYKHHLGAWLSTDLANRISTVIPFAQVCKLASQFIQEGYCGPISFDAILNESGEYEFIYDCNPRLTAVFPALAVQTFLTQQGFPIESVLNLDYRGRYQLGDPQIMIKLLERGWLFTSNQPSGLLYIPNLAKQEGFDVVMVNMTFAEMNAVVVSGLLGDGQDDDKGKITRLYY